ncbi:MAG: hypothetical protein LBF16_03280 [Pseudomonadales bacterium]|jgi:hypothetical protein|nr:hypothetical protein [Pseudomonadales bacterium]
MNGPDLQQILARGEDSRHQFKRDETNADSIAAELAAFANSGGGLLLLASTATISPARRSASWCLPTASKSSALATCRTA